MAVSDSVMEQALARSRLDLHGAMLRSALGLSVLAGIALIALMAGHVASPVLLGWGLGLVLALLLRARVGRAHRRAGRPPASAWLRRYRQTYAAHGLAWASAVAMAWWTNGAQLDVLVAALAAVAVGGLIAAAFDLVAAALFSAPILLALAGVLLAFRDSAAPALVAVVVLFVGTMVLNARRTEALMREGLRLRLAEAERADEARRHADAADDARRRLADQHQLLTQLLHTTRQGCWFIDNDGITTDLNPAMCGLLGRPREAVLGRSVFEFFAGDDLQTLRREVGSRLLGASASYELGITRPDGSRRHCHNNATPLHDAAGRRVGSVGLWTDLTAHMVAEEALRTYQWVANSITDMVSVMDDQLVYRLVNDAWCRATGVAREMAVGRSMRELRPDLSSDTRREAVRDCLASREVRCVRGTVAPIGRPEVVLETTYYPYSDDGAGARCVVAVTRDVTAEAQGLAALQASEAEKEALLEAFPGYIARLDAELRYSYVSPRLAALLGRTQAQMVGHTVHALMGPERAQVVHEAVARALAGETVTFERRQETPPGQAARHTQITLALGADPRSGRHSVYAFGIDISERKQAEQALIAARDDAQNANQAKSRFLSQMSHELRTPMNAILGFAQLLDLHPQPPLPGHQQAYVGEILRGGRHLLGLINDVLDLGRIEAGQLALAPAPMPLPALVGECLALVRPLALARSVRLLPTQQLPTAALVLADPLRLKQVLLNLLGNAIKYNHAGGEVLVRWQEQGEQVVLDVHDTGPGLSAAQQQRLFQPFERLEAAQSGIEGAGIGLALSRRLVEGMAGTIGVDSTPGAGSRFWVRLPRAAPAPLPGLPVPLPRAAPAPPARTVHALYIEDNEVNALLVGAMLGRLPWLRLSIAAQPAEGLALALHERPQLVLLDIQMPGMDGFEVLARLRADPAMRETPVIAVSANARQDDIDAALAAGFDAYLTKPVEMDSLIAAVLEAVTPGAQLART